MASKLIAQFLMDWINDDGADGGLRATILHREKTGMAEYGLSTNQAEILKGFEAEKMANKLASELGIDLDELLEAVWGKGGPTGANSSALYDEGRTHIREVTPAVTKQGATTSFELKGHGFKSGNMSLITIEFYHLDTVIDYNLDSTAISAHPTTRTVNPVSVSNGLDCWQRVEIDNVVLHELGAWGIRARNHDDEQPNGAPEWSYPVGELHVI
jgi:hypothetical protein